MEPEEYAMQKANQKLSKAERRQGHGKQWSQPHLETEPAAAGQPRQRAKKGQHRADLTSYLGFQLKKPQSQSAMSMPSRPRAPAANRNITLSPYFRFALKFPADYSPFNLDPNLPLDWENVLWVKKLTESETACPICLDANLIAPRVSRCGHCFCFPCVLQYLSHGERQDKRCPVCFDTVKANGLKPVEIVKTKSVSEGYTATFTLVRRHKGKIGVYACGQPITGHTYQSLPDAQSPHALFNRMCISFTPRPTWDEHLSQLTLAKDSLDPSIVDRAISLTITEREKLPEAGLIRVPPYDASCSCCKVIHPLNLTVIDATICPTHGQKDEELVYDCRVRPTTVEPDRNEEEYYYFYQLADGQPYFVHPLTSRALLKQFGSWSGLPTTLTARVLEVEDATMSEFNARKMK